MSTGKATSACFNSLQTGNSYQTPITETLTEFRMFASVSIPFKRETPTKHKN